MRQQMPYAVLPRLRLALPAVQAAAQALLRQRSAEDGAALHRRLLQAGCVQPLQTLLLLLKLLLALLALLLLALLALLVLVLLLVLLLLLRTVLRRLCTSSVAVCRGRAIPTKSHQMPALVV
jgi:Flp pilus assembly protein TadB